MENQDFLSQPQKHLASEMDDYAVGDLYDILTKNGFVLPAKNSQWLTKRYMLLIGLQAVWCPKFDELK